MEQLNYAIDSLYSLAAWGKTILIAAGLLILAILYLVWTLHSKFDIVMQNQKVLQEEIKELRGERLNE